MNNGTERSSNSTAERASNCARKRLSIAVSPAVLGSPALAKLIREGEAGVGADVFLVDTVFCAEIPCPRDAIVAAGCVSQRSLRLHFSVADERDAVRAAGAYEQEIRAHFGLAPGLLPSFDVVITAAHESSEAASEIGRIAVARYSPITRRSYVTLTDPVLRNAARRIVL